MSTMTDGPVGAGRGAPGAPRRQPDRGDRAAPARSPVRSLLPLHVGVTAGVAVSVYAVTLAGVTGLQAATDARLAAERAPAIDAANAAAAGNDRLEASVRALQSTLADVADRYAALAGGIDRHESDLAALSTSVGDVAGSAAALPSRVSLPTVSGRVSAVSSRPATSATTGASGAP
jgi:hypothetical protein